MRSSDLSSRGLRMCFRKHHRPVNTYSNRRQIGLNVSLVDIHSDSESITILSHHKYVKGRRHQCRLAGLAGGKDGRAVLTMLSSPAFQRSLIRCRPAQRRVRQANALCMASDRFHRRRPTIVAWVAHCPVSSASGLSSSTSTLCMCVCYISYIQPRCDLTKVETTRRAPSEVSSDSENTQTRQHAIHILL